MSEHKLLWFAVMRAVCWRRGHDYTATLGRCRRCGRIAIREVDTWRERMSDERIVEVMAEGMHNANHCPSDGPGTWLPEAAAALAALRDAGFEVVIADREPLSDDERIGLLRAMAHRDGFEVYQPENCPWVTIDERNGAEQGIEWWSLIAEKGALTDEAIYEQYRLVPISGETPKESATHTNYNTGEPCYCDDGASSQADSGGQG